MRGDIMLDDRLKELDIKKTELANYLEISRPTMYKYIELYDSNNLSEINKKVLKLFDYITENKLIGKNNVISYILNNLTNVKELESNDEINLFKNCWKPKTSNFTKRREKSNISTFKTLH